MAQQATVKRVSNAPPAVNTRRVPPRAETHRPFKSAGKFDYTAYRRTVNKPEEFAAYLAGYPDKSGLILYAYRLLPRIDLTLVNHRETSIAKISDVAQMNPDWIAERFGRGKYLMRLNDANRDKGQTEVVKTWFDLDDCEKPAVYDLRTLVLSAPENIDEVNRLVSSGVLIRDASGAPRIRTEADGPATGSHNGNGAGHGTGELVSRDMIGQVLMKLITQSVENPADRVKQSIEIAKLLSPPAAPVLSIDQLADQVVARLSLNGGSQASADPFDQWERIERFLAKARGTDGATAAAAAPAGESSWFREAVNFLTALAQATPLVLNGLDQLQRRRMAMTAAPGNGRAANGGPQQLPQQMTLAERVAEVLQLGFAKMNEGVNGWDFAAYVCIHHAGGLEVYKFLEPNGTAGVLGLCAMNPVAAPIVSDPAKRPMIEAFLNDFFNYDADAGSGEEEAEPLDGAASA
jgi:hypothetical protein